MHSVCCLPRWGSVGVLAVMPWNLGLCVPLCVCVRLTGLHGPCGGQHLRGIYAGGTRALRCCQRACARGPQWRPGRPGRRGGGSTGTAIVAGVFWRVLWSRFRVPTLKPLCPLPLCVPPPTLAAPLTLPHRHKVQCHIALWIALTFGPPLFPYVQCWQGSHASLPLPLHHDYPSDEDEGSLFFQNPFFSASTSDKGPAHSPLLAPSLLPSSSHV